MPDLFVTLAAVGQTTSKLESHQKADHVPGTSPSVKKTFSAGRRLMPSQFATVTSSLLTGLAGYYNLNGNSNDSLGVTNGTDTAISYVAGNVGNAAQGNGSTSKVDFGTSAALDLQGAPFTIAFWVKPVDRSTYWFLVTRTLPGGTSGTYELRLEAGTGVLQFLISGSGSPWVASTGGITLGVWTHVVLTCTPNTGGNGAVLYLNGALNNQGGTVAFASGPTEHTYFGTRGDGFTHFNFALDEVGFWSRLLTPTEITDLYNAGSGKTYPF